MPPVIDSFTPISGSRCEPVEVVITGSGFTDAISLSIGAFLVFTIDSDTQITVTTDGYSVDSPDAVAIEIDTLTDSVSSVDPFTFFDERPHVMGVSPSSGPNNTATPIVITGSDFTGADNVTVGGTDVPFTVDNDGQISATTSDMMADETAYVQVFRSLCYSNDAPAAPSFIFGAGPPPLDAGTCIVLAVPGFTADGVTADGDGIVYTVEAVDGWYDSIPMRSALLEAQPRGETIVVAHEGGRTIDVRITAHSAVAGEALGAILCFTAMYTIKTAFRAVFVPISFRVVDAFADRTLLARRIGPIKESILGNSAAVTFSIPMLGEDPRRFAT